MYDPFMRVRTKARKSLRRKTVSAFASMIGSMTAPAKPAKRKVAKAKHPTSKVATRTARRGTGKSSPKKQNQTRDGATAPATSRAKATTPRGAIFAKGKHVSEFGTRTYRLYIPVAAKTATGPLPLIVMLHGCGQTPEGFARGTGMNVLAEKFGFLVLYPAQARDAHVNRCWNWFKRDDQVRGSGEPALIADLTQHIISAYKTDPAKTYVAGLSAGASAALNIAHAYPDIFAAVGAHSGLPVGAAQDAASAITAMRGGAPGLRHISQMPTISFQGDSDTVVNPRNGRFIASRALEPYSDLTKSEKTGQVRNGRKYERTTHRRGRGRPYAQHWVIVGGAHAWSGGNSAGSYTDPSGPDASREMVQFFLRHRTTKKRRSGIVDRGLK